MTGGVKANEHIPKARRFVRAAALPIALACLLSLAAPFAAASPASSQPPSRLRLTILSYTSIEVRWEKAVTGEGGYIVARTDDLGFSSNFYVPAMTYSYNDFTVSAGRTYTYKVLYYFSGSTARHDLTGYVSTSTSALTRPTALVAVPFSDTRVDLEWEYDDSRIFHTVVQRRAAGGEWAVVAIVAKGQNHYEDTGLSPNTRYFYKVCSMMEDNVYSTDSPDATTGVLATTRITEPVGVSGHALSVSDVYISWEYASGAVTYFEVERKVSGTDAWTRFVVSPTAMELTDYGLTPGLKYVYRVRAVNEGAGVLFDNVSNWSAEFPISVLTLEEASEIRAYTQDGAAHVTWIDRTLRESNYEVWRRTSGTIWRVIAEVSKDSTHYVDEAVEPGVTYSYKVKAVNRLLSIYSPFSAVATTRVTAMRPPINLRSSYVEDRRVSLTWTNVETEETGYAVERMGPDGLGWREIVSLPPKASSYTDSSLAPFVNYQYRVRVFNNADRSVAYSETIEVITGYSNPPTNLRAVPVSSSQLRLTWNDNSNDEIYFSVQRRGATQGQFREIARVGANETTYFDEGVTANNAYVYRVAAVNEAKVQMGSNEAQVRMPTLRPIAGIYSDYWAYQAFICLYENKVIALGAGSRLDPERALTKGEFVGMLMTAFGLERVAVGSFADVPPTHPYYRHIMTARIIGIAKGGAGNAFRPDDPLTRQDMALLTMRTLNAAGKAVNSHGPDVAFRGFSDAASVAAYARDAMATLIGEKIINYRQVGGVSYLSPGAKATLAEAASIIYRTVYYKDLAV